MDLPPLPKWIKVITVFFIFVFIGIGIAAAVTDSINHSNQRSMASWVVWDGEGEPPYAKIIIMNSEATRNTAVPTLGSIHGAASNQTGETLSYIQITYGIYNENGSKVGNCFANDNHLTDTTTWEYDAICSNLPTSAFRYRVEEVTYW